ncbi:MAG: DHH family phosphoesterase, partial [Halobacteriovoraceae bacterium]|nr:DHH family phosphoesterase [Halobacteriovoraceae bacterium]
MTRFKNLIKEVNNIVITTHIYPDADGIGSQVALGLALKKLDKNVVCVNESPLVERYDYLNTKDIIISASQYRQKSRQTIDLLIVMDTHSLDRLGSNMRKMAQEAERTFFIDHHPCPEELKDKHCIDTSYAATGELVGALIEEIGIPLDIQMALPLYISILIDTNSFRYPTVSSKTHRFIAKLIDIGIKPHTAYNSIYGNKNPTYFKLVGKLLSS